MAAALFCFIQKYTSKNSPAWLVLIALITLLGVGQASAARKVTFYHTDAQGTVVAASDEEGKLLWRKSYTPYGVQVNEEGVLKEKLSYTGKPYDQSSGLTYMGARYFDSELKRFISTDPVEFSERSLMSFNRYAYANNNPYKFVDPDGRHPLIVAAIAAISILTFSEHANAPEPGGATSSTSLLDKVLSIGLGPGGKASGGLLRGLTGKSASEATEVAAESVAKSSDDLMYHYTRAEESAFSNGLWRDTSVTDKLYDDAIEAGQKLGIPTPNKVIPIKNNGQFIPNKPSTVGGTERYMGGGSDFVNPKRVPAEDILPAMPIGGG
ncbi:RHS repeat domain-containing protein [Hahella sp. HN01]|uniref:RHS repeat domain-containing protein n=1 Tax=Hahella sp. HN01 TaxID=2847262 RepID=UPI001C1EE07A|nr:RHS repeat-associated core domain-containing protein [Hahella sp. HN01]MBU6951607.1 hypothetical protein [Hahella sp. HN01]